MDLCLEFGEISGPAVQLVNARRDVNREHELVEEATLRTDLLRGSYKRLGKIGQIITDVIPSGGRPTKDVGNTAVP